MTAHSNDPTNDPEVAAIAAQQSGGAQSKDAPDGLQNADGADQMQGEEKQEPAKPNDGS